MCPVNNCGMSLLNKELVNILKSRTPKDHSTVNLLADILPSLSKEAAYRRLREEIPFTLEEAVIICKSLNISLDLLAGTKQEGTYAFHLSVIHSDDPTKEFCKMLSQIRGALDFVKKDNSSFSERASRSIPQEFIYLYKSLAKVYVYILLYQTHPQSTPNDLLKFEISDHVFSLQKDVAQGMHGVDSVLVMDKRVVVDYVETVKYYHMLGLLSDEDIVQIKKDLLSMLDVMQQCATTGLSPEGKKLDIYISNISFDCSYTYMESRTYKAASIGVYCVDFISSENPTICNDHKLWIDSLIRYSYLISASGEFQRNQFLDEQRSYINTML